MTNNNVLEEYFIWDEKNSTDHNQNLTKKEEIVNENSIIETKNDLTQKDWRDITDPKLRKKMRYKAYYEANKEKIKNYYNQNKDKIKIKEKIYRTKNKDSIKNRKKTYYQTNKDKIKTYYQINKNKKKFYYQVNKDKILTQKKDYYISNIDKIKFYRNSNKNKIRQYSKIKLKSDIKFKLSTTLRSRLNVAIKNNYKSGSAVRDLGCTIEQLKVYLESKFQPGMSWDNYGLYGWHIDHIKPLASFDLTDRKQLLEACHYTNLQPLWAKDNIIKRDKII